MDSRTVRADADEERLQLLLRAILTEGEPSSPSGTTQERERPDDRGRGSLGADGEPARGPRLAQHVRADRPADAGRTLAAGGS